MLISKRSVPSHVFDAALIITLGFLVHMSLIVKYGIIYSSDTATYSRLADRLIVNHFNAIDFLSASESQKYIGGAHIFYMAYIYVVAALKSLFGANWGAWHIGINLICQSFVVLLIGIIVRRVTFSRVVSNLAMIGYLLCQDATQWSRYVLADSLLCALSFSIFSYIYFLWSDGKFTSVWRMAPVAPLILLGIFFKPHGIMLGVFGIASLAIPLLPNFCRSFKRPFLVGMALIASILLLNALALDNFDSIGAGPAKEWIRSTRGYFLQGVVIHDRPETWHSPPEGWVDFVIISLDRLRSFFVPIASNWSFSHNLYSFVFFVLVYGLVLVGIYRVWSGLLDNDRNARPLFLLSLMWIMGWAAFTSISLLDYDWRYRFPVLPILICCGAFGANAVRNLFGSNSESAKVADAE